MRTEASPLRRREAWVLALLVDALQLAFAPADAAGPVAWLAGAGLDILTGALMWLLVGWHWAFLPSFLIELLPFVDIAPTWTLALYVATRGRQHSPLPDDERNPR